MTTPPPSRPLATPDPRRLVGTLLAGGGALVVLGQFLLPRPSVNHAAVNLIMIGGAALFALGALGTRRERLPARLTDALHRPAAWARITPAQLVLLALAWPLAWLARLAAGDGLLAHHAGVAAAAWLAGVGAAVLGSVRWGEQRGVRFGRIDLILCAALILLSAAVRLSALSTLPTTLSGDEASAGLSAVNFLTGRADNWFSIGWFSFPSLFYALQSVAVRLFGQTIFALRVWTALAGAVTVGGLYVLARALFDRTTALMAAVLLAASHLHVHFSRIGLQNTWDGLFTALALAGLWLGWRHAWRGGFVLCGVALGLGQYFYVTFRALPLLVLLWALGMAVAAWPTFRQRLPDLVLAAHVALVVVLPLALYFVANPLEFNAPLQRVSVFDGWLAARSAETGLTPAALLARQVAVSAAGITHVPLQHWYTPGVPLLAPPAAALFVLGVLWSAANFDRRYALLLLPIGAVVVAGGLSQDPPASQRYVIVATLAPVFVALPLSQTVRWLGAAGSRLRVAGTVGAVLVAVLLAAGDANLYFRELYQARGYVLGGYNTETAMFLADYLAPLPAHDIYFFGWPRMNYDSIASVPYLAPQHAGISVMEPLPGAPSWALDRPTLFVVLPERQGDLPWIQAAYPDGALTRHVHPADGRILFDVYAVETGS